MVDNDPIQIHPLPLPLSTTFQFLVSWFLLEQRGRVKFQGYIGFQMKVFQRQASNPGLWELCSFNVLWYFPS